FPLPALAVREVVDRSDERPVLVVEAALPGPVLAVGVAEVPLADDGGLVASLLEGLGKEPLVGAQPVGVAGPDDRGLQPVAERVAAGHQRRPRRRAKRLGGELLEPGPVRGELVDVGGADVRAVKPDVLPAQVVGDDVEDVRPGGLGAAGSAEDAQEHAEASEPNRPESGGHEARPYLPAGVPGPI